MSRDNTVLILGLRAKRRRIWVVVHVSAHEMFGDPLWTRWWLWAHPARYTTNRRLAQHIARKTAKGIDRLEHGITLFFSAAPLDDCILKGGEIDFPEPVERPARWREDCGEDDWEIINP